jgi:hypothetical protein
LAGGPPRVSAPQASEWRPIFSLARSQLQHDRNAAAATAGWLASSFFSNPPPPPVTTVHNSAPLLLSFLLYSNIAAAEEEEGTVGTAAAAAAAVYRGGCKAIFWSDPKAYFVPSLCVAGKSSPGKGKNEGRNKWRKVEGRKEGESSEFVENCWMTDDHGGRSHSFSFLSEEDNGQQQSNLLLLLLLSPFRLSPQTTDNNRNVFHSALTTRNAMYCRKAIKMTKETLTFVMHCNHPIALSWWTLSRWLAHFYANELFFAQLTNRRRLVWREYRNTKTNQLAWPSALNAIKKQ